jgi:hypothetical protein
MNTNNKVVIYLDTQDYSKFSDLLAGKGNEKLRPIMEKLFQFLEKEEIVICYSVVILNEIFQKSENNQKLITLNRKKAKTIELLCGNFCFLDSSEIISILLSDKLEDIGRNYRNDFISSENKWINISLKINNTFIDEIKDTFFQQINENKSINEYEKRQMKKKLKKSLKEEKFLDEISDEIVKSKRNHQLLSVLPDNICRDLIKNNQNSNFESTSLCFMLKPSGLCEILETVPDIEVFWENLNTMKFRFKEIILSGLSIFNENLNQENPIEGTHLRYLFDETRKVINDAVLMGLLEKFDKNKINIDLKKKKISSFLKYIDLFLEISFQDLILSEKSKRSLKESDCGDLMHGFYIPYCDIWRSDKHYADRMKRYGMTYNTSVIGDIFDLIPAIENRLHQKH